MRSTSILDNRYVRAVFGQVRLEWNVWAANAQRGTGQSNVMGNSVRGR